MRPDDARLQHMLDAAQKAVTFTQRKSQAEVESDELLMLALVCLSAFNEHKMRLWLWT